MPKSSDRALSEVEDWPRLTRFYGLSFTELTTMPRWAREQYIEQLPAIAAEEQLDRLQAADFPHAEESARKKLHRNLVRAVENQRSEAPAAAPMQRDVGKDKRLLGGMGIKVVLEPPKPRNSDDAPA